MKVSEKNMESLSSDNLPSQIRPSYTHNIMQKTVCYAKVTFYFIFFFQFLFRLMFVVDLYIFNHET